VLTNVTHRLMARGVIERQGRPRARFGSSELLRLSGPASMGRPRAILIPSVPRARYATESGVVGSYA
jgi:hypothetical protein